MYSHALSLPLSKARGFPHNVSYPDPPAAGVLKTYKDIHIYYYYHGTHAALTSWLPSNPQHIRV